LSCQFNLTDAITIRTTTLAGTNNANASVSSWKRNLNLFSLKISRKATAKKVALRVNIAHINTADKVVAEIALIIMITAVAVIRVRVDTRVVAEIVRKAITVTIITVQAAAPTPEPVVVVVTTDLQVRAVAITGQPVKAVQLVVVTDQPDKVADTIVQAAELVVVVTDQPVKAVAITGQARAAEVTTDQVRVTVAKTNALPKRNR
jgi:hypothetical protein